MRIFYLVYTQGRLHHKSLNNVKSDMKLHYTEANYRPVSSKLPIISLDGAHNLDHTILEI